MLSDYSVLLISLCNCRSSKWKRTEKYCGVRKKGSVLNAVVCGFIYSSDLNALYRQEWERKRKRKKKRLFSTPRGAYVNENHALFVRQREPYIHGRSSNWNNDFLLSSCLLTFTDKISRNMVGHYCRKAVAWIRSFLSLKENKYLVFVRKSHRLQAAVAMVHLNRKVTCFLRTPKQKPSCCTKTHAEQHRPVLYPRGTPILNERCQVWNLS